MKRHGTLIRWLSVYPLVDDETKESCKEQSEQAFRHIDQKREEVKEKLQTY